MHSRPNPPSSFPNICHYWRTMKKGKIKNPSPSLSLPFPDPQRGRRPQVLSVAASSSSPCPEPSRSARRLHLRRLLGTEPKLVASRLHLQFFTECLVLFLV
ncbi:hypothetical protein HN873_048442 [Arachis hypogaea]